MSRTLRSSFNFILLVFLFSCIKQEYGCMDPDAENYEPSADAPCSCCQYFGRVKIVYDYDFASNLKSSGITSLQIYVNGVLYKTSKSDASTQYSSVLPEKSFTDYNGIKAGDDNVITCSLGDQKQKAIDIKVVGSYKTLFQGYITFKANRVIFFQIR